MRGALDLAENRDVELTLVGDAAAIRHLIGATRHRVVDATRVVTNDDSVRDALRGNADSSMRRAIALVAGDEVDAVVSAGNTGALMALSRHLLRMLPGIDRPAIVKTLTGENDARCWLLDLGANIECTAEQLYQFAAMGMVVAEATGGVIEPRVGLLNIGAENSKGPRTVRLAAELIEADANLNFVGFVEANELFIDKADVVVSDGFAGNIALKASEGAAEMARYLMRRELGSMAALTKALLRKPLDRLAAAYNPQVYNGASFVGLKGVVVKSHGAADRTGFRFAVAQALLELESEVAVKVNERFGA